MDIKTVMLVSILIVASAYTIIMVVRHFMTRALERRRRQSGTSVWTSSPSEDYNSPTLFSGGSDWAGDTSDSCSDGGGDCGGDGGGD